MNLTGLYANILGVACLLDLLRKMEKKKNIVFVDTREGLSGKTILATYDQRSEIEETQRQMKCFQGLEKLPSKKYTWAYKSLVIFIFTYWKNELCWL